jgi:hypothetical protein
MIDINTAANIAEIAGGIAILVSLIYVGYQIRQSNRIASAAALQSVLDGFSERQLRQYLEHPGVMGILARGHHCCEELSREDRSVFSTCINREIFLMQHVMQLHGHRLISEEEYQTWLAFTAAYVKTPGGRMLWDNTKRVYVASIVECIEGYLKDNPEAPSIIDLFPYEYGDDAYREYREKAGA